MEMGYYVPRERIMKVFDALTSAALKTNDMDTVLVLVAQAYADIMSEEQYHDARPSC